MKKHFIQLKKLFAGSVFILSALVVTSCTDWDEFRKYTEDGEIVYPGKVKSIEILAGKNRVRAIGTLGSDPRVVSMKVFWNDYADSLQLEVTDQMRANGFDEIIEVAEGLKAFTFYTYDEFGNQSISVNSIGVSYGEVYQTKVRNREVSSIHPTDSSTMIIWKAIDTSTGAKYTELSFESDNFDNSSKIYTYSDTTELLGVLSDTTVYFQTIFIPTSDCIDLFYSDTDSYDIER